MGVRVVEADLGSDKDARRLKSLIAHYAAGPTGGNKLLSEGLLEETISGLRNIGSATALLAIDSDERAVGYTVFFRAFSTFQGKPLINIHDICVHESARRRGIARLLLQEVERRAREEGCCKVTLEVLNSGNEGAKGLYVSQGFTFEMEFGAKQLV